LPGKRAAAFHRYDRTAIDIALDRLSGIGKKPRSAFDNWAMEQGNLSSPNRWKPPIDPVQTALTASPRAGRRKHEYPATATLRDSRKSTWHGSRIIPSPSARSIA